MSDWAAVAKAINERVAELGWPQGELAARSRLSRATVREVQHHIEERHRRPNTLEALSVALGWDAGHLQAVADGGPIPDVDHSPAGSRSAIHARIDGLEDRMTEMSAQLDELRADVRTVIQLVRGNR